MKNRLLTVLIPITALTIVAGAFLLYRHAIAPAYDERLQTALNEVQGLHSYEMQDDTHAEMEQRTIDISGLYRLDFDAHRYGSIATTTLTLLDMRPPKNTHVFTLEHLSLNDDVYVKIQTTSALLRKTIPYGAKWRHFKAEAIPERFVDIAVPGPILDNLALLGQNGSYLSLIGKSTLHTIASTTYSVYTFTISKKSTTKATGPLKALIGIISTGTVDVWVDEGAHIRMIHFLSDGYVATSTILRVNTPEVFATPTNTE